MQSATMERFSASKICTSARVLHEHKLHTSEVTICGIFAPPLPDVTLVEWQRDTEA